MKNALKKAISVLLIAVMVFGAAPLAGFVGLDLPEFNLFGNKVKAAESRYNGYFEYTISNGEVEITNYTMAIADLVIPETLDGYPVTRIGNEAFRGEYNFSYLSSVTIPDTVKSIGSYAFYGCSNLRNVKIGNGVTTIGAFAFNDCEITSLTLGDSLTTIEDEAFYGHKLSCIHIPESVTHIEMYALEGPLTYICSESYGYAKEFADSKGLDFVLCDGHDTTDGIVSGKCGKNLTYTLNTTTGNLAIEGTGAMYDLKSGWDLDYSLFGEQYSPCVKSVVIGSGVTGIGEYAFFRCSNLESVTIPESVTSIGRGAFNSCPNLATVTIEKNVTSIGDYAFTNSAQILCYKDSTAHKRAEEKSWAYWLLDDDTQEEVISGKAGTKLTWSINKKNRKLTVDNNGEMVSFASDAAPWKKYSQYIYTAEINQGCTNISENAFAGCSYMKNIVIPEGITTIGDYAFSGCSSLTEIIIPDSVTSVGNGAFNYCSNLSDIKIGNGVKNIDCTFKSCYNLKSITIPDNVTSIGGFYDCPNLEDVTIGNGITNMVGLFSDCPNIKNVKIGNGVTEISLGGCSNLVSVTMGNNVKSYTFSGCYRLKNITIPEGLTSIGRSAFFRCASLESITIPNGVTTIGNSAFGYCIGLDSINLPDSVTSIGQSAFQGCSGLTEFRVPARCQSIGANAFIDCPDLSEVYILNKECVIEETSISIYTKIYGHAGSTAEAFAEKYGYEFYLIDCEEHIYDDICDEWCNICGEARENAHGFSEWEVIKEPSCNMNGQKQRTCSICGKVEKADIEMLGEHTYDNNCDASCNACGWIRTAPHNYEWVVLVEPTCKNYGRRALECTECKLKQSPYETMEKVGHTYDSDCDTACNFCRETREVNASHQFGDWEVKTESSCTQTGLKVRVCLNCSATEKEELALASHSYGEWVILREPTCSDSGCRNRSCLYCGSTEEEFFGDSADHIYDNDCDANCNICGSYRKASHKFGEWQVAYEPTCGEYGSKYRVCSDCGYNEEEEITELKEHTFDNNCDSTCNVCGHVRSVVHSGEWTVVCEPTCSSYGEKERVCSNCGQYETTYITEYGDHGYDNDCDSDCNYCGSYRKSEHKFNNWMIIKEPICNAYGLISRTCTVCGLVEEAQLQGIGEHKYDNDCDAHCNVCGNYRKTEHKFKDWTVISEPTCMDYGLKSRTCTICRYVEESIIEEISEHKYDNGCDEFCNVCGDYRKTGHKFGDWVVIQELTCIQVGIEQCVCLNCGFVQERHFIKEKPTHTDKNNDGICDICETPFDFRYIMNGVCGPDLTWTLDDDGVLTIKGTGPMYNFNGDEIYVNSSDGSGNTYNPTYPVEPDCETTTRVQKTTTIPTTAKVETTTTVPTTVVEKEEYTTAPAVEHTTAPAKAEKYAETTTAIPVPTTVPATTKATTIAEVSTTKSYNDDTTDNTNVKVFRWNLHFDKIKKVVICDGVTSIGEGAFYQCPNIESVEIADSVMHIGTDAFNNCYSLTTLTTPSGYCSIGYKAFGYCSSLKTVNFNIENGYFASDVFRDCPVTTLNVGVNVNSLPNFRTVETVTFADGARVVPDGAFSECYALKTVNLPDSIEHIGYGAFNFCSSLNEIVIPDSVTYIGGYAFYACASLTELIIPENIQIIGQAAFGDCFALESVEFNAIECFVEHDEYEFEYYDMFNGCENISSVEFGSKVTRIPEGLMKNKPMITSVDIPSSVKEIGAHAFWGTSISDINLPDGLEVVGACAFADIQNVTELTVPESVVSIGSLAFANMYALEKVYFNAINAEVMNDFYSGYSVFSASGRDTDGMTITFGESVEVIPRGILAFAGCIGFETETPNVKTVIIGSNVRTIGDYAFESCTTLETVVFGKNVETIGERAFENCPNIRNIELPESIRVIEESAFRECTGLTEFTIPENVEFINVTAFAFCPSLETVNYNAINCDINNYYYTYAFTECPNVKTINIGSKVESIPSYAFTGCSNLEKVYIPDIAINIDPLAFDGCGKVAIVCKNGSYANVFAVQNNIKYILEDNAKGTAFEIKNDMLLSYSGSAQNIVLPSKVDSVGIDAFNGNGTVKSIEIPFNVSSVYSGAFANCPNLDRVIIPFTVTDISDTAFDGTNATIYCYNNSYAHNYAIKNGIAYELITVTLSVNSTDIILGDTLEVNAVPSIPIASGVPFVWKSSDTSVASVDENGKVTANGNGKATISVVAPNGETLATCSVTVIPDEYKVSWIVDGKTTEQTYKEGDAIAIPADPSKTGYKFVGWTPEVPEKMPAYDLTFTAVFEKVFICPICGNEILGEDAINEHIVSETKVTISDGVIVTSGELKPGATVTVYALQVDGKIFSHWTVDGATVEDEESAETKIVLGSGKITITAEYDDCDCKCHQGGIAGFFFKIVLFFQKLFGNNLECFCGKKH